MRSAILDRYKDIIADPELREFLSPSFAVGCRRPTPADGFLAAIKQRNISVITAPATQMNSDGIIHQGEVKRYDAIVCATGFDTSFVPQFPVLGRNGKNLQTEWQVALEGYMGLFVASFPNYFCYSGPISPIANGSIFPATGMQSDYLRKILLKMQAQNIHSLEVQQWAQDQFNEWAQDQMKDMVWSSGCRSWCKCYLLVPRTHHEPLCAKSYIQTKTRKASHGYHTRGPCCTIA